MLRVLCCFCLPQAKFREASLDPRFHDAASWDSLGVTAHRAWRTHAARVNSEGGAVLRSLAYLCKFFVCFAFARCSLVEELEDFGPAGAA